MVGTTWDPFWSSSHASSSSPYIPVLGFFPSAQSSHLVSFSYARVFVFPRDQRSRCWNALRRKGPKRNIRLQFGTEVAESFPRCLDPRFVRLWREVNPFSLGKLKLEAFETRPGMKSRRKNVMEFSVMQGWLFGRFRGIHRFDLVRDISLLGTYFSGHIPILFSGGTRTLLAVLPIFTSLCHF